MTQLPETLEKVQGLLDSGEYEAARTALNGLDLRQEASASLHARAARMAEQLGELDRAILEYNYSLKADASQPEILRRLGRLRADRGELDRAIRAFRRLLEILPEDVDAALDLASALEDSGRPGEALGVFEAALKTAKDPRIERECARLKRGEKQSSEVPADDSGEESEPISPSDADAVVFASLFAGREGVYARQWTSPTGKHGYTPVEEPFTPAVAKNHLLGGYTVGVYPVRMDNTVGFLAFDLDISRFALSRDSRDARGPARLLKVAHASACRLVDAAAMHEIPALIEDSGWKGRHVWIFFEIPVPAAAARRLADVILEGAGPLPSEITVEIFPKQARVMEGGFGNLVKVPLGIHRVTGRRSVFLDPEGRPVRNQLGLLREASKVPREVVRAVLERAASKKAGPVKDASTGGADGFQEEGLVKSEDAAVQIRTGSVVVEEAAYQPSQDLEFQWILDRCAVLAEIERRGRSSGVLSNDERTVLTFTVGHLPRGPEAVNSVLTGLLNTEPPALLKSRLKGNPMSCPKIRSRVSEIAAGVGCNCRFEAAAGLYPTPLLHLSSLRNRGVTGGSTISLTRLQVERLVSDLIRIRSEMERLGRLSREIEQQLLDFMGEAGVSEMTTASGALRKDTHSGALSLGISLPRALGLPAAGGGLNDRSLCDGTGSGSGDEAGTAGGEKVRQDPAGSPPR